MSDRSAGTPARGPFSALRRAVRAARLRRSIAAAIAFESRYTRTLTTAAAVRALLRTYSDDAVALLDEMLENDGDASLVCVRAIAQGSPERRFRLLHSLLTEDGPDGLPLPYDHLAAILNGLCGDPAAASVIDAADPRPGDGRLGAVVYVAQRVVRECPGEPALNDPRQRLQIELWRRKHGLSPSTPILLRSRRGETIRFADPELPRLILTRPQDAQRIAEIIIIERGAADPSAIHSVLESPTTVLSGGAL